MRPRFIFFLTLLAISMWTQATGQGIEDSLRQVISIHDDDDDIRTRAALIRYLAINEDRIEDALKEDSIALTKLHLVKNQSDLAKLHYVSGFILSNYTSNSSEGIKRLYRALAIYDKLDDYNQLSGVLINLGNALYVYGNIDDAIAINQKGVKLAIENNADEDLSMFYHNLGACFGAKNENVKAKNYYEKAMIIRQELGQYYEALESEFEMAGLIVAIARKEDRSLTASEREDLINTYRRSVEAFDNAGQYYAKCVALANLGRQLIMQDIYHKNAIDTLLLGLDLAKELMDINTEVEFYTLLGEAYAAVDDHRGQVAMLSKYIALHDSIFNINKTADIAEVRTKYETEQALARNKLLEKQNEVKALKISKQTAEAKSNREKQWIIGVSFGTLFLVIVGLLYYRNRLKEKTNKALTIQRDIVSQKNKEILDSIQYAKRIQAAILPPKKTVKSHLSNSFILYKPKDIVAGDFYWMEPVVDEKGNSGVLFAAADCTGHGVPGAMVSVVCNNGLNRSVREKKILDPAEVLNSTREIVVKEFEKSEDEVRDGMDIALCALFYNNDKSQATLKYAGANNPLWIMRQGKGFDVKPTEDGRILVNQYESTHVLHVKADKQPIGKFPNPLTYNTYEIILEKGDMVYLFSDGYADQFGGINNSSSTNSNHKVGGKKMKLGNFKKLVASMASKDLDHQKLRLEDAFREWKGDLEQIDDVCVIGVRI